MDICNEEFLKNNGIDLNEVNKKTDCKIYSENEINEIVADMGIFKGKNSKKEISVVDIVGYDYKWRGVFPNIFSSMDSFFLKGGDGYHSRALGILKEYDKDSIVAGLKPSFTREAINVKETGEGTYVINKNGLHRYTILRIFCLSEIAKANGNPQKLEEIRRKYTIPVECKEVDLIKTYCNYLLKNIIINEEGRSIAKIKKDDDRPENVIIEYKDKSKISLSNEELLDYTRRCISNDEQVANNPNLISNVNKYESLREFMKKEFPKIYSKLKCEKLINKKTELDKKFSKEEQDSNER